MMIRNAARRKPAVPDRAGSALTLGPSLVASSPSMGKMSRTLIHDRGLQQPTCRGHANLVDLLLSGSSKGRSSPLAGLVRADAP